jgi:4-oxalocrotonate tautomerase
MTFGSSQPGYNRGAKSVEARIVARDAAGEIPYRKPAVSRPSLKQVGYPVREKWRARMPEIYVYAIEGRSIDQKRALIKEITDSVVRHFGVDAEAVVVQIVESSKTNKAKGGVLFSERETARR